MKLRNSGSRFFAILLAAILVISVTYVPVAADSGNPAVNPGVLIGSNNENSGELSDRFIVKYKDNAGRDELINSLGSIVKKVKGYKSKANKQFDFITTDRKMENAELIAEIEAKNAGIYIDYIQQDIELSLSSEDPSFDSQWGLYNSTPVNAVQNSEVLPDFRIDAGITGAWGEAQGDGVTVAVIDTGVDITHEDLARNIWLNAAEIAGDGIDNDANGLVDDVNGWDFFDENNQVYLAGDSDHGTHIAGIIAAEKDNSTGIAGVAPNVKIMPLKVFNNGTAYTSDIIEAINYAENMGAKIVNCSWGTTMDNPALRETMQQSNMLFVSAAGNSGVSIDTNPVYPASFTGNNILAVASIGKDGNLAVTSNYGESTALAGAPGEEIISTLPGNTYGYRSGTSMAAAFVSGEAALILSKFGSITAGEVRQKIVDSSDRLSTLVGKVYRGNKINAGNAVKGLISDTIISIGDSGSQDVASAVYGQDIDDGFSTFYTTPQTATGNVFSIPVEGVNGQLNAVMSGNTVTNLLGNDGDCEDTNKWAKYTASLSLETTKKVFGNASITLTLASTADGIYKNVGSIINIDKYYFVSAYVRNGNASNVRLFAVNGGVVEYAPDITIPSFVRQGLKSRFSNEGRNQIGIEVNGAMGQYAYMDAIMFIEITYDEYNNLTVDQLIQKYNFINGTKSTASGRIKSVGKNLVRNGNTEEGLGYWMLGTSSTLNIENGKFKLVSAAYGYQYQLIKVKPNTNYYISFNVSGVTHIKVYNNLRSILIKSTAGMFNTGNNTEIAVIIENSASGGTGYADSIILIEGTIATAYEPYTSTEVYYPGILQSLPDGTKDEVNLLDGTHTKNVGNIVKTTEISHADLTNNRVTRIVQYKENGTTTFKTDEIVTVIENSTGNKLIQAPYVGNDEITNRGKYYAAVNGIWLITEVGVSPTINHTLIYQLSTPITTTLNIPPLTCYAGGTVYIDNAVRNTAAYGNGIAISDSALPIKFIESVYKMAGGTMTPVNLSNVAVASNGLTFTITGAQNGEQYQYTYLYDSSLSTLPTVEFVVPTSQGDQTNDNTNMINQLLDMINSMSADIAILKEQIGVQPRINAGPFKINSTQNNNYNLVLTAANSKDFSSRSFTVIYNTSELEVVDLCAETPTLETGAGNINGTNIVVTKNDPGQIEFFIYNPVEQGSSFSGAVNTIVFRSKINGQATISYIAQ